MDGLGCKTCHMKVSRIQAPDGHTYYDHPPLPGVEKHKVEAIPLDPEQIVEVCDFCLTVQPLWTVPLLEHANTTMFHEDFDVIAIDTDGLWGACDVCAELIRTRQIGKLRNRALAVVVQKYAPEPAPDYAKDSVLLQLAAFWAAVPGPVTGPTG